MISHNIVGQNVQILAPFNSRAVAEKFKKLLYLKVTKILIFKVAY